MSRNSHTSANSSDPDGVAVNRAPAKPPVRETATIIRWRWVLSGGALVAFSTYVLRLFLVSVGVDVLGFIDRQGLMEVAREDYRLFGLLMARWGWPLLYLTLAVGAGLWVGRRVVSGALLHGILMGVSSTVFFT